MNVKILISILVVVLIAVASQGPLASAEFPKITDSVYGFKIDLADTGVKPVAVKVIDESRVLLVGSVGGVYGVAVLTVNNPYSDPVLEDLYPLTGVPTHITTDGYPVTRIAVGSDKGEVLLLRVDKGRITRHLYVVLGADFYVEKVFLPKDAGGNVKVVVLAVEGGTHTYPCLNCHVYVLDEEATGILRVGPKTGNATTTCPGLEDAQVQDVAPVAVYGSRGYYWDLSRVALTYLPPMIRLVFNVTYAELNETGPVPGALVEVSLLYVNKGVKVVYGVNADSRGIVRAPIPLEREDVLRVSLAIRDVNGYLAWQYTYTFDPSTYLEVPGEIPLPPAILPTKNVDTRSAVKVYGIPPFMYAKLDLLDFSLAPTTCTLRARANFFLKPSIRDLSLLRGEAEASVKIVYTDPDEGFVELLTASIKPAANLSTLVKDSAVKDYVGLGARVVASGTFSDGSYLVLGLSDGRLRVYVPSGQSYRLKEIYTMGSRLLNLVMVPGVKGYTYVAVASSGVQVLRVEPYPIPVFRNLASLYLTTPGYVHGDSSQDLSTIALVEQGGLVIVKNSNIAVEKGLVVTGEGIMARDVEVVIKSPIGELQGLNGTRIVLEYPGGFSERVVNESRVVLRNIIPGVEYTLYVYPAPYHLYNCTVTFTLKSTGELGVLDYQNATVDVDPLKPRLIINTMYMAYNVKLRILDEISGPRLAAPLDIYVDEALVVGGTLSGEHTLTLIYGDHNVTIKPSRGFESVYNAYAATLRVERDMEVVVSVERAKYTVTINVMDAYGVLISPVELVVEGPAGETRHVDPPGGPVLMLLPYGNYSIKVNPYNASIYIPYSTALLVDSPRNVAIALQRVKYKVDVTVTDRLGLIGRFELYSNGTKVADNIGAKATVELPYGVHRLELKPMPAWDDVYQPSKPLLINVESDTATSFVVDRRTYRLRVSVFERGEPVTNAVMYIYNADTGEVVTVLTTDTYGAVETGLPYGVYKLVVKHEKYEEEAVVLPVIKDTTQVISLRPTLLTLLQRYMPVIGALVGVGIAIYVVLKIRAIVTKRLVGEEMF